MTGYGEGLYGAGLYGGAVTAVGVPFIPELPGAARVAVEIAWGADLTDGEGIGWVWSEVTSDVRQEQRIGFSLGRNDEASASAPARMTLTLDNSTAAYSLGAHSPNWPNVRRNVPVRVTVDLDDGSGWRVAFQGYATGFTPTWDVSTGRVPVVSLEAAGVLRRLLQGTDPLRSALFRYLTLTVAPTDYWPLEEEKTATTAGSAAGGTPGVFEPIDSAGTLYGKVTWGGDTDNPATSRAVQVSAGGQVALPCRPDLYSGYAAISWSMRYTSGSGAFTRFRFPGQTGVHHAGAYYGTWFDDGTVEFVLDFDDSGGFGGTSIINWSQGDPTEWDDVWHHYLLEIEDIGGGTVLTFLARDGVLLAASTDAGTYVRPTVLEFASVPNPTGTEDPVTVAHVAVFNSSPDAEPLAAAAAAHTGELVTDRLARLCSEEGVHLEVVGAGVDMMGAQLPVALVALLRECEDVDLGVLYDGVGPGLRYVCRATRENAAVAITLDATELVQPFEPVDDDQRTQNRVTATGTSGAKYTHEDVDGPMGTQVIGVYDSSVDVNVANDLLVPDHAAWAVHLGTVEGYRYPSVTLDLRATPSLAAAVLALEPSSRLVVENVAATMSTMPDGDVGLLVEGMAVQLQPFGWQVTLKCSPYGPWVVGELADITGDTGQELVRLRPEASTLNSATSAGATSLVVTTTDPAPRWTQTADDYPLLLSVDGIQVRATACSGVLPGAQTFTIDALPEARAVGAVVDVWDPPGLGL